MCESDWDEVKKIGLEEEEETKVHDNPKERLFIRSEDPRWMTLFLFRANRIKGNGNPFDCLTLCPFVPLSLCPFVSLL